MPDVQAPVTANDGRCGSHDHQSGNREATITASRAQREELPDWRRSWSFNFPCRRGNLYHSSFSHNDAGEVREIFLSVGKPNSEIQQNADTAAILCSLLLQYGVPASTIIHAVEGSPIAMALELAVQP